MNRGAGPKPAGTVFGRGIHALRPNVTLTICVFLGGGILSTVRPAGAPTPSLAEVGERNACESAPIWVFFRDKQIGDEAQLRAAIFDIERSYHPRAVRRRQLRRTAPGLFDERDLPVAGNYVDAVLATGVNLRIASTWLNAVSVVATPEQERQIEKLPCVRSVQPVRRGTPARHVPIESSSPIVLTPRGFYGTAEDQLTQIGVVDMHAAGFTGAGVVIGVLDTGFQRTHEAYNEPTHSINVLAEWDFVDDDPIASIEPTDHPDQHAHGTLVLSTLAGYMPNVYVGGAYDASFILAKTEDITQEVPLEEDFYVAGLQFIEANGADLATSSLGYIDWYTFYDMNGITAVTTIAVNVATANGLVCCTAVGNGGRDGDLPSLIAPSDAFDVISCGAVRANGNLANFSSRGPTADNRVKPEVLARGVATAIIDPYDDHAYRTASGTSLSTPLVASAVALLIQAHPSWTVAHIRRALFETADYFVANGTFDPVFHRGYGVIDVVAASQFGFCTGSPSCRGDLNCDGTADIADAGPFVLAVLDPVAYASAFPACNRDLADVNIDGNVDGRDVRAFLDCLISGQCPP